MILVFLLHTTASERKKKSLFYCFVGQLMFVVFFIVVFILLLLTFFFFLTPLASLRKKDHLIAGKHCWYFPQPAILDSCELISDIRSNFRPPLLVN